MIVTGVKNSIYSCKYSHENIKGKEERKEKLLGLKADKTNETKMRKRLREAAISTLTLTTNTFLHYWGMENLHNCGYRCGYSVSDVDKNIHVSGEWGVKSLM